MRSSRCKIVLIAGAGAGARRRARTRRVDGAASRLSPRGQGFAASQGHPLDLGLADPKEFRSGRGQPHGRAAAQAGAIIIGKTNAPEFGLGSHTYNPVYGATLNAYDQSRSAGGSSGGAAVALALRMLPLADGSDYGGSLRNPAGWNNVLGFRTSFGRVPVDGLEVWLPSMGVAGPMARNVSDLAMLLSVLAGFDPRAPLSMDDDASIFQRRRLEREFKGTRIAWVGDFKGYTPCEPEVIEVCKSA